MSILGYNELTTYMLGISNYNTYVYILVQALILCRVTGDGWWSVSNDADLGHCRPGEIPVARGCILQATYFLSDLILSLTFRCAKV